MEENNIMDSTFEELLKLARKHNQNKIVKAEGSLSNATTTTTAVDAGGSSSDATTKLHYYYEILRENNFKTLEMLLNKSTKMEDQNCTAKNPILKEQSFEYFELEN